ncbi:hypothetical protein [Sphingomonas parapaucimobilis]|uniref:Uncharacterized protein n=1 Tax=Sphingomonas parapaucimobilis NBRC 15100 TaxID=1219049 RepID=A0A0A1W4B6_9SPHN|nr:hypothetical protein [Sphingomonas parapaucimobilis]GAM00193.1 hypothetical protein SP5_025_00010 [Sphingomonas parapaucimobilis NBRC 15100]
MLFTSTTQFAVLGLVLIAGWLFGLASHPGGRKWRNRYATERDAHAAQVKDTEAKLSAAQARIAELEKENQRLLSAQPVAAAPVVERTAPTSTYRPVAASAARPAYPAGERRGWFDFGNRVTTHG